MKIKLISTLVLSAIAATAFAMPPEPAGCPDPNDIKNVSVDLVQRDRDGSWAAGIMNNKFGTNDDWTFVIAKIKAANEDAAKSKAQDGMQSLSEPQGPIAVEQYNVWACLYQNDKGYPAATVNPALGLSPMLNILK